MAGPDLPEDNDRPMRIVSLLPAGTEIVFALGLGDQLIGRSPLCDYPEEAVDVPVVDVEPPGGAAPDRLEATQLRKLQPQVLVCGGAPNGGLPGEQELRSAVAGLDDVAVVGLEPRSIEGILNCISTVGAFAEAEDEAVGLVEILRERLASLENRILERRLQGVASRRAIVLEGLDPPRAAGQWVPEMVRRAGGWELLGTEGEMPAETSWERVREVEPEVIVLALRDLDAAQAVRMLETVELPDWFDQLEAVRDGEFFAVDGAGLFSRPSPRVMDGVAVLAELFDPEAFTGAGPSEAWIPLGPLGIGATRSD